MIFRITKIKSCDLFLQLLYRKVMGWLWKNEWSSANTGLDNAMYARLNESKRRADAGLAEANVPIDTSEWDATIKGAEDAMNQEIAENQRKYSQALSGAAAEINAAKSEWQAAMEQGGKKAL